MAIVLILISLMGVVILSFNARCLRASILKGVIFFSLLVLGVTELLSFFNTLNYKTLLVSWGLISIVLIYFLIIKKSFAVFPVVKEKIKSTFLNLTRWEKFLLGFSIFLFIGVFLQGIFYPTNNWDSMSYHMPRIIHWIKNESLMYYRTPIYPQINSPPFTELLLLNVNLLAGNDYFSNTIQLIYLLATAIAVSLVSKQLGLNRFGQLLSAFIFIVIPEVILLGSSTHNEIQVSFFMIASVYFLLKIIKQQTLISFLLLGCSLGLGVATKSTAYIYIAPFFLFWGVYQGYLHIYKKNKIQWFYYLLMILSFIVINVGHYARNYQLTSNILGVNDTVKSAYVNEEHSIGLLASTVSKNISNQFGMPKIAPIAQRAVEYFHQLINEDVNNPKITYSTYSIDPLATHENNGANLYHTVLMLLSSIWLIIFVKKQDKRILVYWIVIVLSFLLFCFYVKWQPWVKLHTPFFVFYAIVLSHFIIKTIKSKVLFFVIISGFVFSATLILLFNYSRPFITVPSYTSEIRITDDRYKKYFSRFLYAHHDYKVVSEKITIQKLKNIGLMFREYDMEYQLFIDSYRNTLKPIHINAFELCDKLPIEDEVDCIVSTNNEKFINYNGEKYYNVTEANDGYLYLFLKH